MIAANTDRCVDLMVAETPYLRRLALALTQHDADADDLVQETVLRAYRARERLRPQTCMRAWMATILRRAFLTLVRQRRHRAVRPWTDLDIAADDIRWRPEGPRQAEDAEFGSVAEDIDERLVRAVARVPDVYREPLCRHVLGGLTYHEVASQLGIPRGTVMSRIFRARTRLRRSLAGTGLARRWGGR